MIALFVAVALFLPLLAICLISFLIWKYEVYPRFFHPGFKVGDTIEVTPVAPMIIKEVHETHYVYTFWLGDSIGESPWPDSLDKRTAHKFYYKTLIPALAKQTLRVIK